MARAFLAKLRSVLHRLKPHNLWAVAKSRPARIVFLLLLLGLSGYTLYLDIIIRGAFEEKRYALPARVYARALELYPGARLSMSDLGVELVRLGYRDAPQPEAPATFHRSDNGYDLTTREFSFWTGPQPSQRLRVSFQDGRVAALLDRASGVPIALTRLDPPLIGGIYPGRNEDRALLRLEDVPPDLVNALIAVEDRRFYRHWGVDPRGVARATLATLGQGELQGGSTITQQLVKNFFLTPERTLQRKFTEMLMAVLLELHYRKDEILETYINAVYLGQDGDRAIHGFGLASHYYFDEPLERLGLPQVALLVAMVKGPSHYDPRSQPQRALQRRNLVIDELARQQYITEHQRLAARSAPAGVVPKPPRGTSLYPAFLDLVHRQLREDYEERDLRTEGLRIFTTLDPQVQQAAETALATRLRRLEGARRLPERSLEGAVIVTSTQTGEVLALVGGRDARFAGFNRALDARRPPGSLIKPVVYLAALERPKAYTLVTALDDSRLLWREPGIDDWVPSNYDNEFHGNVPLRLALANSFNVATARLGLSLGVADVMQKVQRLGVQRELRPYAASLLGANALSPIEVTRLYQTLADSGFRTPLRAIREIVTAEGKPLQRFPLTIEQVASAGPVYLLTTALQGVVREGTAQALQGYLPPGLGVAGKTGTTDGLRDSWFAGFSGNRVGVVWIGRDDNQSTGLTGASGALSVWGEMMGSLDLEPLVPPRPENVELVWIDPATQLRADGNCPGAVELPFIKGSAPTAVAPCAGKARKTKGWFRRLLQ